MADVTGAGTATMVDAGRARDESVAPWDAYPRPAKPISEYTPHEVGVEGEHLAQVYLVRRGYTVEELNWRCPGGEADIICEDESGTVVLVEVKTRVALGSGEGPMPELAVGEDKQRRYRKIALYYLAEHPEVRTVRFDVVAICIVQERMARLRHLLGAFSWDDQ